MLGHQDFLGMYQFVLIILTYISSSLSLFRLVCLVDAFMRLRSHIVVGISLTMGLGNPGLRSGRQVTPPISAISVQYLLLTRLLCLCL